MILITAPVNCTCSHWQSVFSLRFWSKESPLSLKLYDLHCAVPLPPVYCYTHTCKQQHTYNIHLRSLQQRYVCFLRPAKVPANVYLHSILQPCDSALTQHHHGFLNRQPTVLPLQRFLHFQKPLKHILQRQRSLETFSMWALEYVRRFVLLLLGVASVEAKSRSSVSTPEEVVELILSQK